MRLPVYVMMMILLAFVGRFSGAQELRLESGGQRTQMIELYTSEGCNSCPPAEAFLNGYVKDPQLWKRIIPLALHVDYWDYLGWKDRYASAAHSQRQRDYARWLHMNTVYTPALFVNGSPWRNWRWGRLPAVDERPAGELVARLSGRQLQADYTPVTEDGHDLELHVAVLGMGLVSQIQAGENRGRTSVHEFVVLWHQALEGGGNHWQAKLPTLDRGAKSYALVVWVSGRGVPAPLQAVGGYLP